jgi:hypothetical protein
MTTTLSGREAEATCGRRTRPWQLTTAAVHKRGLARNRERKRGNFIRSGAKGAIDTIRAFANPVEGTPGIE